MILTLDPSKVYVGGYASESIVYEYSPTQVFEIICSPLRYTDDDADKVAVLFTGMHEIEVGPSGEIMGSLTNFVQHVRTTLQFMAPPQLQYKWLFLELRTRSLEDFQKRLGVYVDMSPSFRWHTLEVRHFPIPAMRSSTSSTVRRPQRIPSTAAGHPRPT